MEDGEYVMSGASYVETFEVESSTATTMQVQWQVQDALKTEIVYFLVHHQKVASSYIQYGPKLPSYAQVYNIRNLVADTYYKVCLVTKRNDTGLYRQCMDASTTNWPLSVSIGSSVGAVLALSIIVLIVFVSRCQIPFLRRNKTKENPKKYNATKPIIYDELYFDFCEPEKISKDLSSEWDYAGSGYLKAKRFERNVSLVPDLKCGYENENDKIPVRGTSRLSKQNINPAGGMYTHLDDSQHRPVGPIRARSMETDQRHCCVCECEYLYNNFHRWHSVDDVLQRDNCTNNIVPSLMMIKKLRETSFCEEKNSKEPKVTPVKQHRILKRQKSFDEQDDQALYVVDVE